MAAVIFDRKPNLRHRYYNNPSTPTNPNNLTNSIIEVLYVFKDLEQSDE
jgi:hypothetical protein